VKIISLDIGDKWTGIALSDQLGILARPYDTVQTAQLLQQLELIFAKEPIAIAVVGLPTTLRGTHSEQTKKVIAFAQDLEKAFPTLTWTLWDERLTSKQAASLKSTRTKQEKLQSHAIAAALILSGYLESRRFAQQSEDD